ncbi:MAG TPA: SHOCT domain-containing protein [Nocardioides sp.]|uniref:SHOCT domain-containing protein n=1 Tax=Nocardioides sp. TaxID=35761 RepID=UPI002E33DF3E|nr:SHOCT domain-containing protein [Nocardioides sp.]HEX5088106.1 SHOCT domain-containing protein [Nocardioides sp.]
MVLVPRQLLRSGMTGNVPYYGGRFTPAQAYAASHPSARPPARPPTGRVAAPPVRASAPPSSDAEAALGQLRDSGVLTAEEYAELMTRVTP